MTKMTLFNNFYKLVALLISDRISSMLELNFDMKDLECKKQSYTEFSEDIPKFAYVGLFKYKSRGVLLFIDAKIIYMLSNKMLGGKGIIETKPKPLFTFSEDFIGKELLMWFSNFFEQNKIDLKFLRVENRIEHIHYFFPDETIASAKMKCKIDNKQVGMISFCHPMQFVDAERLVCDIS